MFPKNPARVIQRAQLNGLRALVALLRARSTKDTQHLYGAAATRLNSAIQAWLRSKKGGKPNFALVTREEKHLRKLELESFWNTARRYGSHEQKRVKNEREGEVGPLNMMLNIVGAQSRDYHILMWPMPRAKRITENGIELGWGYHGGALTGDVLLGHGPDLAEFDLMDMTRSHARELARKAFVLRVDFRTISRYALLLNRRFTPFVDYVYTHGVHGSKSFKRPRHKSPRIQEPPCADQVLRSIVNELEALYGINLALPPKPSAVGASLPREDVVHFFETQVEQLRARDGEPVSDRERFLEWAEFLEKLSVGKNPLLHLGDARQIYETIANRAKYAGSRHHRIMARGFVSPRTVESVVLDGDRFLSKGQDILVVSELKLDTPEGIGRADIAIFKRMKWTPPSRPDLDTVMKPIGVFEIKTKSAFTWELRTKKPRGKKRGSNLVPAFVIRQRCLTEREFERAVLQIPTEEHRTQLERYIRGLLAKYHDITADYSHNKVVSGVILLDSYEDAKLHRDAIMELVGGILSEKVRVLFASGCQRLVIRNRHGAAKRAVLIIDRPDSEQAALLGEVGQTIEERVIYNPFSRSSRGIGKYILYLGVRSASRSGRTAAWISVYYHGLQYIADLLGGTDEPRVLWVDLAGVFGYKPLAEIRLRLSSQKPEIRQMFRQFRIVDVSSRIDGFLFRGESPPNLNTLLERGERPDLLVVSGWQLVKNSCPPKLEPALRELEKWLVSQSSTLSDNVLWFVEATNDEFSSFTYQRPTVIPFEEGSPHQYHVTDIVWNLPVRPYAIGRPTPLVDDLRVVVEHTKGSVTFKLVEIPPLRGWSTRFRGRLAGSRGKRVTRGRAAVVASDIVKNERISGELIDAATELIPWIVSLYHNDEEEANESCHAQEADVQAIPLFGEVERSSGILSLVNYEPGQGNLGGLRSWGANESTLPAATTLRRRCYRQTKTPKAKTITYSSRPPDEGLMEFDRFDERRAARLERKRLRAVVRFLAGACSEVRSDEWNSFLKTIQKLLAGKEQDWLQRVVQFLSESPISSELWQELAWRRERSLGDGLRLNERKKLDEIRELHPTLALKYGNYLVLLILAASMQRPHIRGHWKWLWDTVKSWQLEQLGFSVPTDKVKILSRFDPSAIFHNLRKRVSIASKLPSPKWASLQFGQLWSYLQWDTQGFWLFIEDEYGQELMGGFFLGRNPLSHSSTFHWSVMNHGLIAEHADVEDPDVIHDLLVTQHNGARYIHVLDVENREWVPLGRFEIVQRKRGALTRIRGVLLFPQEPLLQPSLEEGATVFNRSYQAEKLHERIRHELQRLAVAGRKVAKVKCSLAITPSEYIVEFCQGARIVDRVKTASTARLLRLLRGPLVDGCPLPSSSTPHRLMSWDVYCDIEYNDLQFLQPFVERKTPYFHVEMPLPETAEEVYGRIGCEVALTLYHDRELCPIANRSATAHGACWRLKADSAGIDDVGLAALINVPLSETEAANLLSGERVFLGGEIFKLRIKCEPDPATRDGIVFREARRIAGALKLRPVKPGTYLVMDSEELYATFMPERRSVSIPIWSNVTGERVGDARLQLLSDTWDIDEAIEVVTDNVKEILYDYFGRRDGDLLQRVTGFENLVSRLYEWLLNVRLGELESEEQSREILEQRLEILERIAEFDSSRKVEVAEELISLARLETQQQDRRRAMGLIERAVVILKQYIKEWNDDAARELLRDAQQLQSGLRRI